MDDGIRTHDNRDHNPGLYQLSYVHRTSLVSRLACPAGLEPATLGLEGRCSIRLSYGHDPKATVAGPAARGRESYVSSSSSVNFRLFRPTARSGRGRDRGAGEAGHGHCRICYTAVTASSIAILLHEVTCERPAA